MYLWNEISTEDETLFADDYKFQAIFLCEGQLKIIAKENKKEKLDLLRNMRKPNLEHFLKDSNKI